MLTATPINNRLSDFRHMAELFTRRDEAYFARTLGVNNLRAHFNSMEKALRDARRAATWSDCREHMAEAQEILATDEIFRQLVVQRSRAYARESQIRETGKAAAFPERKAPQVAEYSIRKTYGQLLDMFEKAFQTKKPLFTLPMYYPLAWYKGPDTSIDPLEENRQKQVVGLIRTQFLKRFESSVVAFELSCDRLLKKLLAFLEVHSETDAEKKRLERWKTQNASILGYATCSASSSFWGDDERGRRRGHRAAGDAGRVERLDREEYDVAEMIAGDLPRPRPDRALPRRGTEVRAEARRQAAEADPAAQVEGAWRPEGADLHRVRRHRPLSEAAARQGRHRGRRRRSTAPRKGNRADVIQRFAPYYNGSSSAELAEKGRDEIRVLISTDVLSEGLNLQDASRMINYDIHWNPVRLMQRIGRVDRRMNPEVEERLDRRPPGGRGIPRQGQLLELPAAR